MDAKRLSALPGICTGEGCAWRIQRQVHVQPNGAARRLMRHAPIPHQKYLPQLLRPQGSLAVFRHSAGCLQWRESRMTTTAMVNLNPKTEPAESPLAQEVRQGLADCPKHLPAWL